MKPKVKKIPWRLKWTEKYAEVGDLIQYWLLGSRHKGLKTKVGFGVVGAVRKNRYGRISYFLTDGTQIFTEELTPLQHEGCTK